jgi:hypothetical protein
MTTYLFSPFAIRSCGLRPSAVLMSNAAVFACLVLIQTVVVTVPDR